MAGVAGFRTYKFWEQVASCLGIPGLVAALRAGIYASLLRPR